MEKEESCAGFDLNGDLKKTRVCLIVTKALILTNCNTNCSTTGKYCKNMAFFWKTHQSYSVGDQMNY